MATCTSSRHAYANVMELLDLPNQARAKRPHNSDDESDMPAAKRTATAAEQVYQTQLADMRDALKLYIRVWNSQPTPTNEWRPGGANFLAQREQTYGEITLEGMVCLFAELGMGPNDLFVDIGSGLGNMVLYAAQVCKTYRATGIEIQYNRHIHAQRTADDMIEHGDVNEIEFVHTESTDVRECHDIKRILGDATVVFCNNVLFSATSMAHLTEALLDHANDDAVFVFVNDPWPRRRTLPRELAFWKKVSITGSASWCSKTCDFFFYTKSYAKRTAKADWTYASKQITPPRFYQPEEGGALVDVLDIPSEYTFHTKATHALDMALRASRR